MNTTVLSTFILTALMMVGLPFFIRASVKDRTEQIQIPTNETEEEFLPKLQQYFSSRAYQVVNLDKEKNQVTFEGFVQPSIFLAIFLSFVAGVGLFCLALIVSFFYSDLSGVSWLLLLFAPIAGVFYWKKAGRLEKVLLSVEPNMSLEEYRNLVKLTGHRDELKLLRETISFDL